MIFPLALYGHKNYWIQFFGGYYEQSLDCFYIHPSRFELWQYNPTGTPTSITAKYI
jgi:hypothetical protein